MDLSGHEREIPIPLTIPYVVYAPSSNTTRPPPPSPPPPTTATATDEQVLPISSAVSKKIVVVKYRECLKNHAASMGGNATDGCGEFMQGGEEGTPEAFRCSACSCHRNFHRKEVEGLQPSPSSPRLDANYYHLSKLARNIATTTTTTFGGYNINIPRPAAPAPPALIMPLGAMHTSEYSDDKEEGYYGTTAGMAGEAPPMVLKKRFRTKFTQEQKEKMLAFADKVGWRLPRQEEGLVQQFCQEIGVRRRVLKVWMHNNKHSNLAKKNTTYSPAPFHH